MHLADMEYEEERGCVGKEEAKNECRTDSGSERLGIHKFMLR